MGKPVKSDGTLDNRTELGRATKGKDKAPKATEKKVQKGVKNNKKHGKAI